MIQLLKLAAYTLFGYAIYEFILGLTEAPAPAMQSSQSHRMKSGPHSSRHGKNNGAGGSAAKSGQMTATTTTNRSARRQEQMR